MAHSLFQEDPTYNFIMQSIYTNNYMIVITLLNNHNKQFVQILANLPNNIIKTTVFLNEFQQVFSRLQNNVIMSLQTNKADFRRQLADIINRSQFIYILNDCIRSIIKDNKFSLEDSQMICQTLMQIQLLYMNIDPQGFIDLFFKPNGISNIFWGCLHRLLFSDQTATHPLVDDIIMLMFPSSTQPNQLYQKSSNMLKPQLLLFLNNCQQTPLNESALSVYNTILQHSISYIQIVNEEVLKLCTPILEWIGKPYGIHDKQNIIQSVKLFKFLLGIDQSDVSKYLIESGVAERFLQFKITKKNEGIFEGLLRETVHHLNKNLPMNITIAKYMCGKVKQNDPIRKSTLLEPLFNNYQEQSPSRSSNLPPPASPSIKSKQYTSNFRAHEEYLQKVDEEKYFQEDHQDDCNLPETNEIYSSLEMIERRLKLEKNMKRRRQNNQEEHEVTPFFEQKRKPELEFQIELSLFESLDKKIKNGDELGDQLFNL